MIMIYTLNINRIRKIVSFKLGKEIEKVFFILSRAWEKEKNSESLWGMEPQAFWILRFDALPPSLRDSMESNTNYKVNMTCVLYTARISNVDCIMFYKL